MKSNALLECQSSESGIFVARLITQSPTAGSIAPGTSQPTPSEENEATVFSPYPNPFSHQTTVNFNLKNGEKSVVLEIYDFNGHKIKSLYTRKAEGDKVYSFTVDTSTFNGQFFFARLTTSKKVYNFRLVKSNN